MLGPKKEDVSKLQLIKPRSLLLLCCKKLQVDFLTLFHLFILKQRRHMQQVYFDTCFTLDGTLRQDVPGFLPRITESTRRRAGTKTLFTLFFPTLHFYSSESKLLTLATEFKVGNYNSPTLDGSLYCKLKCLTCLSI